MNDKIVLVNIKSDRVAHPLGPLYVGSALKKAGFDVKIYNIQPGRMEPEIIKILSLKPLFVGFSVFTGIHTAEAAEMSRKLKEHDPATIIVCGGIHPSLVPQQCLDESFVDIAVVGEGEQTAVELSVSLQHNSDLAAIKGIGFKSKGKVLLNAAREQIENLDDYKLDWSLIDVEECIDVFSDGTRSMSYMSSRGCPFNCGFCYNRAFNKRRWRFHSFEHVVEEIASFKEISGINGIVFNDDNFMVDMPRAFKILQALKNIGIKCVRLEMRLDLLDEKVLDTIYGLGVRSVFVGWESGSDRILKLINKGITRKDIIDKFRLFSRYPQIGVSAAGIIGFPTETWEETCETIDMGIKIAELVPANMTTFQTFLPYPGTDLYPLAIKAGFNPPKQSIDWGGYNTFYGDMKLEWLPWATRTTPRTFYRIDKYGKLLNHAPSSSFLRTLGKKLCYFLSKTRLRHRFFHFPIEIFILHRFNRYYLDLKGKLIKR